ncbi:preprotein translocase subunit SecA [Verrucomicrobiota bacterium]
MIDFITKKIFGTKNERDLKKLQPLVDRINQFEAEYQTFTDEQLKAKTPELQQRLQNGETTDDILCEAFAVVKNACRRLCGTTEEVCGHTLTWNMVPYDVQLIGGIAIHQGKIAEMATGEGKTLVATLPVYLNALTGKGAHVVTVNDYLARRDSQWMGLIYEYLGLTVGCIQNQMFPEERRAMYNCDITYGTNAEFGFDYLRDNTATRAEDLVQQRGHNFAIIDEIDSILIDEARTPLIISGPAPHSSGPLYAEQQPLVGRLVRKQTELVSQIMSDAKKLLNEGNDDEAMLKLYQVCNGMPKNKQLMHLQEDPRIRKMIEKINGQMLTDMFKDQARELREELYFNVDEKGHDAHLTEKGSAAMSPHDPEMYVLPDLATALSELEGDETISDQERLQKRQQIQEVFTERSQRIHAVDQLIRAYCVYEKDVSYVVQNDQVMIVDEYTGRIMPGRRWSDGLHMAIEAKEGVKIERETQTLASITIQNYFRMYEKLSGMTGTAETEAGEFNQIYNLDVCVIPTNRPCRRIDANDMIYRTQREKLNALLNEIEECHQRKQPVLVGTVAVDASEVISRMLRKRNIPHNVLNAKNHEREAEIVSMAGQPGAVTIATNMAGRGTDIKLGEGVVKMSDEAVASFMSLNDKYEDTTLRKFLDANPSGLYVIASERHESRRIDRQLRGRCARQGDPGMSKFYVSLEDDLMRLFGSERISNIMARLGIEEGEVLEHPWLNKSLETAQRRVEEQNFMMRKRTLEYDDVMNKQREVIYDLRRTVLLSENPREQLFDIIQDVIQDQAEFLLEANPKTARQPFVAWANETFPVGMRDSHLPDETDAETWADAVFNRVKSSYEMKATLENPEHLPRLERQIILSAVDEHWQEYLRNMDSLREGIGLRAYGQRDPLIEYKKEAFTLFSDLMDRINAEVAQNVFRSATSLEAMEGFLKNLPQMFVHNEAQAIGKTSAPAQQQQPKAAPKTPTVRVNAPGVGRNDPCPCGSGKKFKKCCGANS